MPWYVDCCCVATYTWKYVYQFIKIKLKFTERLTYVDEVKRPTIVEREKKKKKKSLSLQSITMIFQ